MKVYGDETINGNRDKKLSAATTRVDYWTRILPTKTSRWIEFQYPAPRKGELNMVLVCSMRECTKGCVNVNDSRWFRIYPYPTKDTIYYWRVGSFLDGRCW